MKFSFVELGVSDLAASRRWYRLALGLEVQHDDTPHGFVLLHDGHGGKIALKEGTPGKTRLNFEVESLDAELARLADLGIVRDSGITVSDEGYRGTKLRDPDGNAVTLFEWTG